MPPIQSASGTEQLPDVAVPITAAMLYDVVHCPHRLARDLFDDHAQRDPTSPFVRLLWERGTLHEKAVAAALASEPGLVDLSAISGDDKEARTLAAMADGAKLIYRGRIRARGLLGEPDLLRRDGDGYVPGDIKSGSAEERRSGEDGLIRPKLHYAMQLGLYIDVLERLGLSSGRYGFIWDVESREVAYDFAAPRGPKSPETLWDKYESTRDLAVGIAAREIETRGAYAAPCKLCPWYTSCLDNMSVRDDPTLVPGLGRAVRDTLAGRVNTIAELAAIEPESFIVGGTKTVFRGVRIDRLTLFASRARLLKSTAPKAYLRAPIEIPSAPSELFFDIEVDPLRRITYLHGFVERHGGEHASERFVAFFANEASAHHEREAFAAAWAYIKASQPCVTFYYSKYERTIYRELQARYPDVCGRDEIESFFNVSIDLYCDVVLKATEWPTRDYSIKTLAKYLGFEWRDKQPSGAASIEWYDRWLKSRDPALQKRILAYNEDDCRATRVLLDGIRLLKQDVF